MEDVRNTTAKLAADAYNGVDGAEDALKELVEGALAGFGEDADEVAATLAAANAQGKARDRRHNPIARHLVNTLGASDADVDECGAVVLFPLPDEEEWPVENIDFPSACSEFIEAFDEGHYPHLVEAKSEQ